MWNEFLSSNLNPTEHLITPIAPYYMCDHFISNEIHPNSGWKYISIPLNTNANDLLKNNNVNDIKNFDIIQVQVDLFNYFIFNILPILIEKNIKIILLTSQWNLPQINRNFITDELLNNDHILLWVSQNPIYTNHKKYMALPYGISHKGIHNYVEFIRSSYLDHKPTHILNQYASVHNHLPPDHIRKKYSIFGKDSGDCLNYQEYLTNIMKSKFVISTSGDRDDCYRHYEIIGLDAIPISNITDGYKEIFENNMIYSNAEEMIDMIQTNNVKYEYKQPNKDMLTISYWKSKIKERLQLINL